MASSCPCSPSSGLERQRRLYGPWGSSMNNKTVLWFTEGACRDARLAGGKGASLARMSAEGLPVPPGFVIPAYVLEQSVNGERLRRLTLAQDYLAAQALIQQAEPPREAILAGY